jgi:hypothetical protein
MEEVHCVALKQRNLNWLTMIAMHHACALAKHFDWADPRTTAAKNICIEYAQRRPAQIA